MKKRKNTIKTLLICGIAGFSLISCTTPIQKTPLEAKIDPLHAFRPSRPIIDTRNDYEHVLVAFFEVTAYARKLEAYADELEVYIGNLNLILKGEK